MFDLLFYRLLFPQILPLLALERLAARGAGAAVCVEGDGVFGCSDGRSIGNVLSYRADC